MKDRTMWLAAYKVQAIKVRFYFRVFLYVSENVGQNHNCKSYRLNSSIILSFPLRKEIMLFYAYLTEKGANWIKEIGLSLKYNNLQR